MSLLRKIRRKHKAFASKESTQIAIVDETPSVSSVEDGDEDDDTVVNADGQSVQVFTTLSSVHEAPPVKVSAEQGDVSGLPLNCIPSYADEVDLIVTESRFWPWIAKTGVFLLVSLGAFYIGKVATVAITFCLLLACRLSETDRTHSSESSKCTEFQQADQSDESITTSPEKTFHDHNKVVKSPSESFMFDDGNKDAEIDVEVDTYSNLDEETFSTTGNENSLSTKRKQLKRLNCIKLPPSALPLGDSVEESPSSAKASPRTWFRSAGNNTMENSTGFRKELKNKSKALFRRLRKKEPHSSPSSPLWSDSEAINGVSEGSDSERTVHGRAAASKPSKFRPRADASKVSLELSTEQGDKQPTPKSPDSFIVREDGMVDVCTTAFCKAEMKQKNVSPLWHKENQSPCNPPTTTSGEGMTKLELPTFVITTQEVPCRTRGTHQFARKPVAAPVLQGGTPIHKTELVHPDSSLLHVGIPKREERMQQKVRGGTVWLTSGLAIITAGLLMGRMVAVAGLVCYWYALSLVKKRTKTLAIRRQKPVFVSEF